MVPKKLTKLVICGFKRVTKTKSRYWFWFAEVQATSHKPDEIYGIIERLSPGTRKIELFGRPHNVQPNWVTLGNQLDGIVIHDDEMLERWNRVYPEGYQMVEGLVIQSRKEP